jgi:hypothetical protein
VISDTVEGFVMDRHAHTAGTNSAILSTDRTYRYVLERDWGPGPAAVWIMLNPSTADAEAEDATSRRCINFTRRFGNYGGLIIVNLYSLRATDPRELWTHSDPIGPLSDHFLFTQATARYESVIAAWGTHGARNGRGEQVARELTRAGVALHCLGTTKDGHPKHPLYVPGDTPIVPFPQVATS